jgi:hypothetical protein
MWIVDDLPQHTWPQEGSVYADAEVYMVAKVGPDGLPWVHPMKDLFGAKVVAGRRGLKRIIWMLRPSQLRLLAIEQPLPLRMGLDWWRMRQRLSQGSLMIQPLMAMHS